MHGFIEVFLTKILNLLAFYTSIDQSNGKKGIWIDVDFFSKNFQSKQTMRCLLDTESNWNLIPSEFATTDLIFSEREIPEEVSLVGVSGAKLSGRALSTFTLKIGLILMQTEFFVCNKAMSFPIIGLSFLNLLKAEINCNNNTVKLHSEYAHETISYAPYLQSSFLFFYNQIDRESCFTSHALQFFCIYNGIS